MNKVYILVNPDKADAVLASNGICEAVNQAGFCCSVIDLPCNIEEGNAVADGDFLIVLGGDGSIINAARATVDHNIPIIGVNYGTVGYLTAVARDNIEILIDILRGNHTIERRMMLDIDIIRDDKIVKSLTRALNEAVISNGPVPHILEFDLYCDGNLAQRIRADGIIIATPTGSSAYSMSAGGPIMDPSLSCICATPICPHHLNNRPVIFSGESVIEIRNAKCRNNDIYLSADGKEIFEIGAGDVVRISKSKYFVPIVTTGRDSFIEVLNSKL